MEVFKSEPQVRDFMYDPLTKPEEKYGLIKDVVGKADMNQFTSNFLNLLVDMGRFELLEEISDIFNEEILTAAGTKQVLVRAAVELGDDAMLKIADKVKKLTGVKKVEMRQDIDESLMAGFVIDMDSQQIDMSLKNELEMLKQELINP